MKRVLTVVFVLAAIAATTATSAVSRPSAVGSSSATCRGAIGWQNARSAVGRVATIRGRVAGTRYAAASNGSPTFLNLGVNYPNPKRFTVVIWIENRSAFGRPEVRYRGRQICVRGRVQRYRGVPEIEARSPAQIKVIR